MPRLARAMWRWATAAAAALFVTALVVVLVVAGSFSRDVRPPAPPIELTGPDPHPGQDPALEPAPTSSTGPPTATG